MILSLLLTSSILVAQAAFTDVPASHEFSDATNFLQSEGIIQGFEDGSFRPEQSITRAEFIAIVLQSIDEIDETDLSTSELKFSDVKDGRWENPYLREGVRRGFLKGYPDNTVQAKADIKFVEAAKIITIAFGSEEVLREPWYKPYVLELGRKDAIPVSIDDFSKRITRGEMAEIIYRLLNEIEDKPSQTFYSLAGEDGGVEEDLEAQWRNFALLNINQVRAEHQKPALIMSPQLNDIAMAHSKDMAHNLGEMSHEGSLNENAADRIKKGTVPNANGTSFINLPFPDNIGWSGENVGKRTLSRFNGDVERAILDQHAWFLDEPDDEYNHRTTMLSTLIPFTKVGIGIYEHEGVIWYTADFISTQ